MPTTTPFVSSSFWSTEYFSPEFWSFGTLPGNFLVALTNYLEAHPPLLAELGGSPRVYVERAGTDAVSPYVLVEGVRLAPSGESDDDEVATCEVNAYGPNAPAVRSLGRTIVAALDPPALNDDSTRPGRLTWAWGEEQTALRTGGRVFRVPGGSTGTRVNWAQTADYEFRYRVPTDAPQVAPDAAYEPAEPHGSLPQAVLGYLAAAPALTALLGGAGKVYPDLATAPGTSRPFVILEDPQEDPDGESDEDEAVRMGVAVQAAKLRVASAAHELLRSLLDSPNGSRRGRRAAPLAWEGGVEDAARWTGSRLELFDGLGPNGADVWSWTADYEFRTHRT